ncbi:mechanosensitive ion channel family protein [Thioclava sp. GXIMD4215]|uniref:mechanosensitive ion channel family protein n=1 Tax=Thioclava sp. GXIMD4215 TaxID=3131928 RepID=UPI0032557F9B
MSDLREIWLRMRQGVAIGDLRLTSGAIATLLGVFALGSVLTRWLQFVLRSSVLPRTRVDAGSATALVTGLGYLGTVISAFTAVSAAGLDLSSLAVVAGALSLGVGFGLQTVVSNFVSGVILLIERPVKEGDWIEVAGISGIVQKISVRSTRIETFDRHDVIVPNTDLVAGTVKNMTLGSHVGRLTVPVSVAYGTDVDLALKLLMEIAESDSRIQRYPQAQALFIAMGESGLELELRCMLWDISEVVVVRSDLLRAIYRRFAEHSIEIPFPQRDIRLRGIEEILERFTSAQAAEEKETVPQNKL